MTIAGTAFADYESLNVRSSIGTYSSAASFEAIFPNHNGVHKTSFSIGNEVKVWSEKNVNPATVQIFIGTVEDVKFYGNGPNEKVVVSGRDYTSRLQDATVQPISYNNTEVSVIVKDLIDDNVSGITYANVNVTTTTLNNITFNHISVFDAIKQLAEICGFIFWIDTDKDLNFKLKGSTSSGVTLDNTNVMSSSFRTTDREMYNKVWVYGDRVLSKYKNTFTATGGSAYSLTYQPHNTEVLVGGSTSPKVGGVFNMLVATVGSPTQYLVDYEGARVVFVSGTSAGNNIPVSGTDTINVTYDRSLPIVKFGTDRTSIDQYGARTKVIIDKGIKDANMARDVLVNTLELNSVPRSQGSLELQGTVRLIAGNTVVVNLPNQNISSQTYDILEANYEFTTSSCLAEKVLSVTVSKKIGDVVDSWKQMIIDIKKLQAENTLSTDVFTRLEFSVGSAGLKVKEWFVKTRSMEDSFIIGRSMLGSEIVNNFLYGEPDPNVAVSTSGITWG